MWSRNQRQIAVHIFLRRLRLLGFLVLAGVALWGVWGVYLKERESAELRAQAEREKGDLVTRKEHLESEITHLKSDRGLEETLREQYALAGEGEGLIVIVDQGKAETVSTTSPIREWFRKTFWWW